MKMTEHKYLDSHSKAKTASLLLGLSGAGLLIIGAFMAKGGHSLPANLLLTLGAVLIIALVCFAIHYQRHNEYDDAAVKAAVTAMHLYAVHAVFTAAGLYAGKFGTFSYGVIHAIADGLLAGLLIMAIFAILSKRGGLVAAIGGIIVFILSLLSVDLAVNIGLAVIGAGLTIIAIIGLKKNKLSFMYLLAGLLTVAFAIIAIIKGGQAIHMYLHFAIMLAGLVIVAAVFATAIKAIAPAAETAKADTAKEEAQPAEKKETAAPVKAEEENNDVFNRAKWIDKSYQGQSAADLLNAPVDALYGVSESDAQLLKAAFGIKTIGDLADSKYFAWAGEIAEQAEKEK